MSTPEEKEQDEKIAAFCESIGITIDQFASVCEFMIQIGFLKFIQLQ